MAKDDLENEFRRQLEWAKMPTWVEQYAAIEGRRFCWDFAWPEYWLLVEINGGTCQRPIKIGGRWYVPVSGHNSMDGISRDNEKGNLAAIEHWFTMSFDSKQLKSGQALKWVQDFFDNR